MFLASARTRSAAVIALAVAFWGLALPARAAPVWESIGSPGYWLQVVGNWFLNRESGYSMPEPERVILQEGTVVDPNGRPAVVTPPEPTAGTSGEGD